MLSQQLREKFENFSRLPDRECAFIIQNNLLEALASDTYIDWDIVAKFIMNPSYADRESLCKLFNSAIKKNSQKIGNITINEWLKRYLDYYAFKERNPNTFFEFVSNNPEIRKLPRIDQLKLMRIFRMYDYMFVIPIIDLEGPVFNILRFSMHPDSSPEEMIAQNAISEAEIRAGINPPVIDVKQSMKLADALAIYPKFGEQLITSEKISLHNFPEPVRPSIKNWIADYTFSTGHDKRSAMERSIYIFQGPNGKHLTPNDRQKLAYVLKAYDENLPITINKNSQQIVFGASPVEAQPAPAQNAEVATGMSFSYPQKLPYERKNIAPNIIRTEERPKPLPKNVVNLKE